MFLLLLAALAGPPDYDVFAECDYGRVLASAVCQQREEAARAALLNTWDYHPTKQTWCVQQVAQSIQIYQYMWLLYCLVQPSEQPPLPTRVRPFWGPQPN